MLPTKEERKGGVEDCESTVGLGHTRRMYSTLHLGPSVGSTQLNSTSECITASGIMGFAQIACVEDFFSSKTRMLWEEHL